jgi:hypothetical protein
VLALAVFVIASPGTSTVTVAVQAGSVPPAGQFDPGADVLSVLVITLLPASGLFTVTVPVTVTTPPTGISPVHEIPDDVSTSVPDVAVWSPFGDASSNTSLAFVATVIPLYGACPVLVNVAVYRTTPPGVAVLPLAVFAIASDATGTVLAHRESELPAAQLLPAADDDTVLDKTLSPVSGLLTVTENVTVAEAPGASVPVQVRSGLANTTDPAVADASPLYEASSSSPDSASVKLTPDCVVCPVLLAVTV